MWDGLAQLPNDMVMAKTRRLLCKGILYPDVRRSTPSDRPDVAPAFDLPYRAFISFFCSATQDSRISRLSEIEPPIAILTDAKGQAMNRSNNNSPNRKKTRLSRSRSLQFAVESLEDRQMMCATGWCDCASETPLSGADWAVEIQNDLDATDDNASTTNNPIKIYPVGDLVLPYTPLGHPSPAGLGQGSGIGGGGLGGGGLGGGGLGGGGLGGGGLGGGGLGGGGLGGDVPVSESGFQELIDLIMRETGDGDSQGADDSLVTKVYPVGDLVVPLMQSPLGGGGFGGGEMGDGNSSSGADFSELVNLVLEHTDDNWDLELPAVPDAEDTSDEVADLSDQLRRLQDIQVTVEVRFITVTDDFFERINVDIDFDLQDNGLQDVDDIDSDDPGFADPLVSTTILFPVFDPIAVTTTVTVPDGSTLLLGGIKRSKDASVASTIPNLNAIPYISRLFVNAAVSRDTRHVLMMVTPRIIIMVE